MGFLKFLYDIATYHARERARLEREKIEKQKLLTEELYWHLRQKYYVSND